MFGLADLCDSGLAGAVGTVAIALRALHYFCDHAAPNEAVFRYAVVTISTFLHRAAGGRGLPSPTTVDDLVQLLKAKADDDILRRWVESHFGPLP